MTNSVENDKKEVAKKTKSVNQVDMIDNDLKEKLLEELKSQLNLDAVAMRKEIEQSIREDIEKEKILEEEKNKSRKIRGYRGIITSLNPNLGQNKVWVQANVAGKQYGGYFPLRQEVYIPAPCYDVLLHNEKRDPRTNRIITKDYEVSINKTVYEDEKK